MPVTPAGAVEQMMLEELRRSREASDRMFAAVGELKTQIALITQENQRSLEYRTKSDQTFTDHSDRINKLESWKDRQEGATGILGWLINSPVIGWLAAAGVAAWAVLSGKGHP